MKSIAGLIGFPLAHSISPAMQQAAFDYHHIPAEYCLWEVEPDGLRAALDRLRRPDCLGANVTIPYKRQAIAYLDELSSDAAKIAAVNTIARCDSRLIGHNTDAPGFLRALEEDGRFNASGKQVVLLGAGGAARAVAFALATRCPSALYVVNRQQDRAEDICAELAADMERCSAIGYQELFGSGVLNKCDLLVNATPVGLQEGETLIPRPSIPAGALVCDLTYRPTKLLEDAESVGARTLDGLPMLVYQGAVSFSLWTGMEAPVRLMKEAALRALGRGG